MSAYQIDLDPVHVVVRLTVTVEIVTPELAEDIYKRLKQISSIGGPYATIYDLTMVKDTTISSEMVKDVAFGGGALTSPNGKTREHHGTQTIHQYSTCGLVSGLGFNRPGHEYLVCRWRKRQ